MAIKRLLIANRGEIALRIHRAARNGHRDGGGPFTADADAMHVRLADHAVCIGRPRPRTAISTSPRSSRRPRSPSPMQSIRAMASCRKTRALPKSSKPTASPGSAPSRASARWATRWKPSAPQALGLPLVPGSDGAISDVEEARKIAEEIGYPVIIKAASGGGGRGMKVCTSPTISNG
jgi:acetyl-CoA carboxylase biotin carboxylase subunit